MAQLTQTRQRLRMACYVMGAVSLLSAIYLLLPVGASTPEKLEEFTQLRDELKQKQVQVLPLRGLEGKLSKSQKDIVVFYEERLPRQYSTISYEIGRLASASGARLSQVKYDEEEAGVKDVQQISIDADLSGDYKDVAEFINQLERSKTFFLIDNLDLTNADKGQVELKLKMRTFLLTGRPRPAARTAQKSGD